jgi:glycosyltransferase involved in cell wall biosynthesis
MQRDALAEVDCLHATALSEYHEIRAAGLRAPVAVIPNGIDLPEITPLRHIDTRERVVLFVGRIHPKKGLDPLVRAWKQVSPLFPQWQLRILGPAERGHDDALRSLAKLLSADRIEIGGPVYNSAKLDAYRKADLFVLPTLNENFGTTVAEALAAEVPVITTKGAPWPGLETERCGWWIDHGVEPLARALGIGMSLPATERNAMGRRGRAWMAREFSWERVAREMLSVYAWLARSSEMPSIVRLR